MVGIENYTLFLITALLFIMTPGIDTVFVLNKSISQGRTAGIYSTFGVKSGVLIHTLFAALGLSMILAQSAIAFSIIKYLGALYLIYMGISAVLSKKKLDFAAPAPTPKSNIQNFYSGFITNVLNPKVALFFLSFFPQFIKKEYFNSPVPFVTLGITYAVLGLMWFLTITYFSSMFSARLKENPRFNNWMNKASGAVYILMGIKIAMTKK